MPSQEIPAVFDIHAVAIEQQHAVSETTGAHIDVVGIRAVQIYIRVHRADIGSPEGVRLPLHKRKSARARTLAQAEQRRGVRQVSRNFEVLVFEHHRVERGCLHSFQGGLDARRGVEEDLIVRDSRHSEPERVGGVGELDKRFLRKAEAVAVLRARLIASDERTRHFPTRVVAVRNLHTDSELAFHSAQIKTEYLSELEKR